MSRSPGSQAQNDANVAQLRSCLGEAVFAVEWEVGREMTLPEAEALVATLDVCVGISSDIYSEAPSLTSGAPEQEYRRCKRLALPGDIDHFRCI